MEFKQVHNVYLIGIGGIGMSALARYFKFIGKNVAGYDKTPGSITDELISEGIPVFFTDSVAEIPIEFKSKETSLVIYTPAIPENHKGLIFFRQNGFGLHKRSIILGSITNNYKTVAVAGTHGKTSVSTAIAHLLNNTSMGCLAFLGGISKNYQSNLILPKNLTNFDQYAVAEADEFDRSFLQLNPNIALITSMDADHLDIYGTKEKLIESFNQFVKKVARDGVLIFKKGLELQKYNLPSKYYNYAFDEPADFYAKDVKIDKNGLFNFSLITPGGIIKDLQSGVPGKLNAENAIAASSLAFIAGLKEDTIRENLRTFKGVQRRFDYQLISDKIIFIDDYAHHPEELKAFISSVREIYGNKKITGIFQPHLYTRTRDFCDEFAKSLDLLDELILLEIYPAREEPIEGVNAGIIYEKVKIKNKKLCTLENLKGMVAETKTDILLTMGAGNIDQKIPALIKILKQN